MMPTKDELLSSEIKPCQCGIIPRVHQDIIGNYRVKCIDCEVWHETEQEAIKAWNTRHTPRCDECKYLDATGLCSELYAKYFEYDPDLYSEDYRQTCFHVRPEKDFHCAKFSRRED